MLCNKTEDGQSIKLKTYLKNHTENKSHKNVVLGIQIENYSHLNLTLLSHHQSDYNSVIDDITDIGPFSEYIFVMDNLDYLEHGVYGSMSWNVPVGNDFFRFVLTYYETY